MRNRTRIKIAFDMCLNEGRLVLGIIVTMTAFILFGLVFQMLGHANSYAARVQSGFSVPLERVGYCYLRASEQEYERAAAAEILRLDEITAMGDIAYGVCNTCDCLSFLREVQLGHEREIFHEEYLEGGIEMCVMNMNAWDIMNLKLSSGKPPSEYEFNRNTELLYLPREYRGIAELGEHYYEINEKDGSVSYDYVVAGFLAEDSRLPAQFVNNSTDELINRGYYSTEYSIIEVVPGDSTYYDGYFSIKEGTDFDGVKAAMTENAGKHGVDIEIYRLASVVGYAEERSRTASKYMLEMGLLLGAAAMVLLISIQTGRIIAKAGEYGIWLTNGAGIRDIIFIIIYQNIIYILPALLLSIAAVYFILPWLWSSGSEADILIREMMWKNNAPLMLALGAVITAVVSLIPVLLIRRSSTAVLVKGELE